MIHPGLLTLNRPLTPEERAEFDTLVARYPVLGRGLADSRDRVSWARARSNAIGASDAARYAKTESVPRYIAGKLYQPFQGNTYTQHGNEREPIILGRFGVQQNFTLYASAGNPRHVATPDGLLLSRTGTVTTVQCKTTVKPLDKIPPSYQRQCQWEMYVTGATRCLFVWELHDGAGNPVDMEPQSSWLDRDDSIIENLIIIADLVLAGIDSAAAFEQEMSNT